MFGNTREVAEAIARGIRGPDQAVDVVALPVGDATPEVIDVDLLVVGAPTHMRRMTSSWTRELRARSGAKSPGSWAADQEHWERAVNMGIREWLAALPRASGDELAAVFDTRLSYIKAVGAGPQIVLALRSKGYRIEERPRCFFVESPQGPVKSGEHERAVAWGTALRQHLTQRDHADR